jgi:hypothetical protein
VVPSVVRSIGGWDGTEYWCCHASSPFDSFLKTINPAFAMDSRDLRCVEVIDSLDHLGKASRQ